MLEIKKPSAPGLKVLIIYPIDPAGRKIGGIETAIRNYVKYAPDDFNIEIAGVGLKGHLSEPGRWQEIIFAGRKVNFLPLLRVGDPNARQPVPLILRFVAGLVRWRRLIDFRGRVVVFHRLEPAYVLTSVKADKVLFLHGDIPAYFRSRHCENKWRYLRKLYFWIEPRFITGMKKVFVVSRAGRDYYERKYARDPVRFLFLPTWYDPEVFFRRGDAEREKISAGYGFPPHSPRFLFVGRLEKQKNPVLLIESFLLISRRRPDAVLLLAGDGEMKSEITGLISKHKLEGKVFFLPGMSPSRIAELMNVADVLLLTSAWEGMPRVVLEALACGLPVAATDVGETGLVVGNGTSGRLVASGEPRDIAAAALALLDCPPFPRQCQDAVGGYSRDKVLDFFYRELRTAADPE